MNNNLNLPKFSYIERYLTLKGWERIKSSPRYGQYVLDDNVELILPKDDQVKGARAGFADALNILSQVYEESIEDIILKIQSIKYDLIRSKLPDQMVVDDTIDLDTASEYIFSLKRLMSSSAATEINKGEAYSRLPKKASKYVKSCRFGHTFKGSFGFLIESPLNLDETKTLQSSLLEGSVEQEDTFERKVVTRLAHGLKTLHQAEQQRSVAPLIEDCRLGFNVNMLDELTSLHQASNMNSVTFDFLWSEELSQIDSNISNSLTLNYSKIEIAEDAIRQLKTAEVEQEEHVIGHVTQLRSEIGSDADNIFHEGREVVIHYIPQGQSPKNIHVNLSEAQYLKAIQAHEAGQYASVKGRLSKQGRFWYLLDTHSFTLI